MKQMASTIHGSVSPIDITSRYMKLLNSKPSIKLVLVVAAVGLAAVACTSSEKESKGKTPATAEEETEVIDSNMPEREGALLPRKDSLALAKLYKEYEKAAQDLYEHTEIFGDEYDRKLAKIKTDFEASLTGNPNYAPVVELRNLLIAYQKDMRKDEEHKYDVDLKLDEAEKRSKLFAKKTDEAPARASWIHRVSSVYV